MAVKKKKISEYDPASSLAGLWTLGYTIADGVRRTVRVSLDFIKTAVDNVDKAVEDAEDATDRLNALSDHRDKIIDGFWWHWNEETGKYEPTGEQAHGNVLYATFDVDPGTGELAMHTDELYDGPTFDLENGNLIVEI